MIHILDASFRYEPSFDTDVRRTFERIRRQQQAQAKPIAENRATVLLLDQLKKKAAPLPAAAARTLA
jgi:uncharacterized protein YeeX (DUF496 family)